MASTDTRTSAHTTDWTLLAGLRFGLALTVFLFHCFYVWPSNSVLFGASRANGTACVAAFLMISGYSIAHSISARPAGFLKRRFLRIYPIYFLSLSFALLTFLMWQKSTPVPSWMPEHKVSTVGIIGHFFFAQPFFTDSLPNFTPSWTLSIEVLFYALAPLLLRIRSRFVLMAFAASAIFYTLDPFHVRYNEVQGIVAPAAMLWAWLLGWLLFRCSHSRLLRLLIFVPPVLFLLNPQFEGGNGAFALTITGIALAWPETPLSYSRKAKRTLLFLGDLSYPLYLIHWPVIYALHWCGSTSLSATIVATFIASLLLVLADSQWKRWRLTEPQQRTVSAGASNSLQAIS